MKLSDIHIRDPYILKEADSYYLYGTRGETAWEKGSGFPVYKSSDLENWEGPQAAFSCEDAFWGDDVCWAPEVHKYMGKYYMFATFGRSTGTRGVGILVADKPEGPFADHSKGPVTPNDWMAIDGTLYIENGKPYLVFVHEWNQIGHGTMCAMEMTADLTGCVGEAILLFSACDPAWANKERKDLITDGPYFHKTKTGKLAMLWSTFVDDVYIQAVAYSDGLLTPWTDHEIIYDEDGGHGMLFYDENDALSIVLHAPNKAPHERAHIFSVLDDGTLRIKD